MNLSSLAKRNIKKSFKDYVVYFLTLILGVSIFYIFNSLGDQDIIWSISQSDSELIELMLTLLEVNSVGVAFVLGFLIIYANNFLIKRRKREFGIYLLLGMDKKSVSKILFIETFMIGILSLGVGIVLGVLSSQFVSILVGHFFDADMSRYTFVVSGGAVIKTIIYFLVIYCVVLLFHAVTISKYRLIDLFSAGKKVEKLLLKNPVVATVLFIMSVVTLGYAYYRVGFCGMELYRNEMLILIVAGIISTFVLFWSISGFLSTVLKRCRKMYYKDLNSFLIQQFCSSINSFAVTMSVICLMLFVGICTFSSGLALGHQMQENIRKLTPVDYSIMYSDNTPVSEVINKDWKDKECVEIPFYTCETIRLGTSFGDLQEDMNNQFPSVQWDTKENIVKLSDYNRLAKLYKLETVELEEDEYAILCDFAIVRAFRDEMMARGGVLHFGEVELKPALSECVEGYLYMSGSNMNIGIMIVPDAVVDNEAAKIKPAGYVMAGNYATTDKDAKRKIDDKIKAIEDEYYSKGTIAENGYSLMLVGTKIYIVEANNGLTMLAAFVGIYNGIIFLITSATLLSLKAMSESIDSVNRYSILKKIGGEPKQLRGVLFAQVGVYFMVPFIIAGIHSIFGLRFVEFAMSTFMNAGVSWGVAVAVMLIFYGAYMLLTYKGAKEIVGLD